MNYDRANQLIEIFCLMVVGAALVMALYHLERYLDNKVEGAKPYKVVEGHCKDITDIKETTIICDEPQEPISP